MKGIYNNAVELCIESMAKSQSRVACLFIAPVA
jgi:hypothetical protein